MADPGNDELNRLIVAWRAGDHRAELYLALRDPMRQAARRGIRRTLGQEPDEGDVDDVVLLAFRALIERTEPPRSPVGLACLIAERRGIDKARALIRERQKVVRHHAELTPLEHDPEDEIAAARRDRMYQYAVQCMETLTGPQREAIEATVQRQESLSDWTAGRGTSYEAGRRMVVRALMTLNRCVQRKIDDESKEERDGRDQ